jgi:hypothetical protein
MAIGHRRSRPRGQTTARSTVVKSFQRTTVQKHRRPAEAGLPCLRAYVAGPPKRASSHFNCYETQLTYGASVTAPLPLLVMIVAITVHVVALVG